jgi:hypothetical protein
MAAGYSTILTSMARHRRIVRMITHEVVDFHGGGGGITSMPETAVRRS